MGQIGGPQIGQIRDFFRSDFSAFGAGAPNTLKSDLKKPRICPIWGQSDPLWSQTSHPWLTTEIHELPVPVCTLDLIVFFLVLFCLSVSMNLGILGRQLSRFLLVGLFIPCCCFSFSDFLCFSPLFVFCFFTFPLLLF